MPVYGLQGSFQHAENGMTLDDMNACAAVANTLNEVIIFRSTGPWSQRWIERNYPTKNFHVKGKSSDWGPQAGFVPYLGKYSKVAGDKTKEDTGTAYNDDGLKHSYTKKTQLCLTLDELNIQLTRTSGTPPRTAIHTMTQVQGSKDYFLYARSSSDTPVEHVFRAIWSPRDAHYKIGVFDRIRGHQFETPKVLEVMTSSEVGAMNKPLTGDYDLMAVCPTWNAYGERSRTRISKAGVNFGRHGGVAEVGQVFEEGVNMDGVVDMRTNTGMRTVINAKGKHQTFGRAGLTAGSYNALVEEAHKHPEREHLSFEHPDMGNITPRILRCINYLNNEMGQNGPFRRVHHNAESHRNAIFGGITGADMKKGDAFPLTLFQPNTLLTNTPVAYYTSVATLETLGEFKAYALLLHQSGYYVPRSWTWGMSIRDMVS